MFYLHPPVYILNPPDNTYSMATITVTDTRFLETTETGVLKLKITVGFMQASGSYVVLISSDDSRKEIFPDQQGIYTIPLEHQSIISCITVVQDINLSTNNTSVKHNFTDANPDTFTYEREVEHHNDRVIYDIQYILL